MASLANGISKAKNILKSEDVIAAINAIRNLGIKVNLNKNFCKILRKRIEGYNYKKNITINAQNSGTLEDYCLDFLLILHIQLK